MVDPDLLFRHILENMQGGVLALDGKGHVRAFNPAAERMLGLSPELAGAHPFATALFDDPANDGFAQALLDAVYEADAPHNRDVAYHRGEEQLWLNLTTSALWAAPEPGAALCKVGVVALFVDITKRKEAEAALLQANGALEARVAERTRQLADANVALKREIAERVRAEAQLAHLAEHDALTGLANRRRFEQCLEEAVDEGETFALLYLDLDGFKAVNDAHGHEMGDWVLQKVSRRISGCVRAVDMVARLGGDEFAVVLRSAATATAVEAVVRPIIARVEETYRPGGDLKLRLSVSIGIALHPKVGTTPAALLQAADKAMYAAKHVGQGTWRWAEPHTERA